MNNLIERLLTALLSGHELALSGENGNEFPGCTKGGKYLDVLFEYAAL
jgi:hypothetical protein